MLHHMFKFLRSRASKEPPAEQQTDLIDSLMSSAELAAREGDPERAIQLYSNVIRLQPKHGMACYKRGNVLKDSGKLEAALASYDLAIELDPDHANAFCNRGAVLERMNRLDEALASFNRAIALNPRDAFAHCNRGILLGRLGRPEEALASFDQAIAANRGYAEAYFNRGSLLQELRRLDEALASYGEAIQIAPGFVPAYLRRGMLQLEMKQSDAALASFDKTIELDPRLAAAHCYRGVLLEAERPDAALASYDKAIELDPRFAEAYYNRGVLQQRAKNPEAAMADYDKAIELVPHFAEAHSNRGALLHASKQSEAALASYDKAVELDPGLADAFLSRAAVLMALERWNEALASLDRAISLAPGSAEAHSDRGEVLYQLMQPREAVASFDRALALKPDWAVPLRRRTFVKMSVCDWRDLESTIERITAEVEAGLPLSAAPLLISALVDAPALQLRAAQIRVRDECPPDDRLGAIAPRPHGDKIRVGYYSPDFRSHSVARLTAELFELHDRSSFEITAFAFGPESSDPYRRRLEQAFDRFLDVRDRSDLEVAALSRELGIDVAVDLAGATAACRTEIFALRAAPVQLSYIGFLGTTGAPYMDYLIADATIIPPDSQAYYSEKIIYLPSYQANDSQRKISERIFTREELGLPAQGFVFSCYNSLYKIQPATFETWMRIMHRVPDSALCIHTENADVEQNLLNAARRSGVHPKRVVFAKRLNLEEYLARFRTMDLFLDTWPYNAGTTASDALWAGLPVVTYTGHSFASRCATSLLKAIDLPELITESPQQYEELAVELATNPQRLAAVRQKLADHRHTTPLFDTRSFTRHLESAYARICERYRAGLPPEHIYA
jgi:predicted O-linked N-acetylglucosamine transferase (SPINDLY family)